MKCFSWLILSSLLFTGCFPLEKPTPVTPPLSAPDRWHTSHSANPVEPQLWLDLFEDETLELLVQESLTSSYDIGAAAARVLSAHARLRAIGVQTDPDYTISGGPSANHRYTPLTDQLSDYDTTYSATFQVSWEADLWDQIGHQERAARLGFQAQEWDFQALQFSLAANVAKTWFNAKETQLQFQLVQQRLSNLKENLSIVEEGFRNNLNSALDVHLARSNVASEESRLAQLQVDRERTVRALEFLIGVYPDGTLPVSGELPELQQDVPVGLPSDLLKRRADVRAAELRLKATNEEMAEAYLAQFPSFRLTGSVGLSSENSNTLVDIQSVIWSLAANVSQPLWNGDDLQANLDQRQAEANVAAADYGTVVLTAFQEVETALASEPLLKRQAEALAVSAEESRAGEELALEQYRSGLVNFVTVLEAQRRAFDAQRSLIQVQNARIQNRINLYLALGGDFTTEE